MFEFIKTFKERQHFPGNFKQMPTFNLFWQVVKITVNDDDNHWYKYAKFIHSYTCTYFSSRVKYAIWFLGKQN